MPSVTLPVADVGIAFIEYLNFWRRCWLRRAAIDPFVDGLFAYATWTDNTPTIETPTVETSPYCLCVVGEGTTVTVSGGEAAPQLSRGVVGGV